ncbi:J domain-containing protein [Actinomadura sp. GTD37]|uniref:J domain-containing protein n=1 Tax=Actinomadura sp. GTD37 TaxID=1778030 RepID=UPI0035BFAE94
MPGAFRELDGNDAYELLSIPPDAAPDRIQRAWRELAAAHHPDRITDPAAKARAEERLRLINAARDVLLKRRASYDAARRAPEPEREPDEETVEDPWDTAATRSSAPDPWDAATAGPGAPDPWDTAVPGNAPAPPPPGRDVPGRRTYTSGPRRRPRADAGCMLISALCWALIIGVIVVQERRPDGPSAEASVRGDLAGTWKGTVRDRDGDRSSWAVELTLKEGKKAGEVRYLHGRCAGTAVPVSYAGKALVIETDFPDGQSGCDVGDITLTRRKDGKADIVYYASDRKTKRTTGVLRRRD